MSNRTEDRLRRALAARAEQVSAESLRPLPAPAPSRPAASVRWVPVLTSAAAVTTVIGLAYSGLGGADDVPAEPMTRPTDRVVTGTACPRERQLVATALDRRGVEADVDGDGRSDRVALARDGRAEAGCRVFVGVRTATGTTYSNALGGTAVADADLPFPPTLAGLPRLGEAGAEIVVDAHARADGALVQLFTLTRGRLARVAVPGSEGDAFYLEGGGVTTPQGAACRADGTLVLAGAEAQGRRYRVTRQPYELVGDRLQPSGKETTGRVARHALARRFPEFTGRHFADCEGRPRSSAS